MIIQFIQYISFNVTFYRFCTSFSSRADLPAGANSSVFNSLSQWSVFS